MTLGLVVCLLATLTGCHPFDLYSKSLQAPVPPQFEPPNEKKMVSLPDYRIEPPDVLQLEVLKLVPKPPYRVDVYDVLKSKPWTICPNIRSTVFTSWMSRAIWIWGRSTEGPRAGLAAGRSRSGRS